MSDRPAKPDNMSWLNPYMVVTDVRRSLEFYERAFGFETRMTLPDGHGNFMHAEMGYKGHCLMLGSQSIEQNQFSAQYLKGSPVFMYVYVDDVDKFFRRAVNAGAEPMSEPKTQFWGDRTCSVLCMEGYRWTFVQNVADFDPDKVPK